MAIHLSYKLAIGDAWTSYDTVSNGVCVQSTTFSYSSAGRLDFYITAPEQSAPIPRNTWVLLWDDVGLDETGSALSAANPLFLGIVVDVNPGQNSNQVAYVCMDPTYMAGKSVTVMSQPYQSGYANRPAVGAVPRLVYNVKNMADADYAYEAGQNGTVGTILAGLLDYCFAPLQALGAAPASGTTHAYDPSDLSSMSFVPQEKLVWESVTIRAAIEQVWRHEPRFRMFWHPAQQLFRFYQLNAATATTLYLNSSGSGTAYPVIGAEINPSYEDCYTAVSIYGPPNAENAIFSWYAADTYVGPYGAGCTYLLPYGSSTTLQTYSDGGGTHTAVTYAQWQIADATQRAGARILPSYVQLPEGDYSTSTKFPVLLASWDNGGTWIACKGVQFDNLNGICTFPNNNVPYITITDNNTFGTPGGSGSTQTKFPPNAMRLLWAPYQAPLQVRYPATGYDGTAYTTYGCTNEYRLYDDALAIGYEYGIPVTSTERLAAYTTLAQYLHSVRCDVITTGTLVLAGIDYSWRGLNRRVNIADAAGSTTGWESINAIVTDVEYTYGDTPSTTLTFNADWLQLYGEDPAALRERLRIKSYEQYTYAQAFGAPMMVGVYGLQTNYNGSKSEVLVGAKASNPYVYVDPLNIKDMQEGTIK